MYDIVHDRIFWIYFIVTLFFVIIGVGSILASDDPYLIIISIAWLLSSAALLVIVYHTSINWGPTYNTDNTPICVIDSNSGCFNPSNRVWLFINVLFVVLLVLSTLWACELSNTDASTLQGMSGVLVILGGLMLAGLLNSHVTTTNVYIAPFPIAVAYLVIWFGMTLYVVIR
jgi:hypothetical protein